MKIFADFHHGGLGRSLFYLFGDRLGHDLRFPSYELSFDAAPGGTWNSIHDAWVDQIGGIDRAVWESRCGWIDRDEFMATDWDLFIISRPESQAVFDRLNHPNDAGIQRIGLSGNDGTVYDWDRVRHLISTDEGSFRSAPAHVARILTGQEIGRQYGATFKPITEERLREVHSYMNYLPVMDTIFRPRPNDFTGCCPHCRTPVGTSPRAYNIEEVRRDTFARLPGHTFKAFGHGNESIGGECLNECDLPAAYASAALTWHVKDGEGWGHSALQSVVCGRPVIVSAGFFRYRNAGRYLIPGITCYETEPDPEDAAALVMRLTQDLDTANRNAARCYKAAQGLFDWEHEAWRVEQWLN